MPCQADFVFNPRSPNKRRRLKIDQLTCSRGSGRGCLRLRIRFQPRKHERREVRLQAKANPCFKTYRTRDKANPRLTAVCRVTSPPRRSMRVLGHMRLYASCQPSGCWAAGSLGRWVAGCHHACHLSGVACGLRSGTCHTPAQRQPSHTHQTALAALPSSRWPQHDVRNPDLPTKPTSITARSLARSTILRLNFKLKSRGMDHGDMRNKAKSKPRSSGVPRVPALPRASAWWSRCNAHVADCLHQRQAMLPSR